MGELERLDRSPARPSTAVLTPSAMISNCLLATDNGRVSTGGMAIQRRKRAHPRYSPCKITAATLRPQISQAQPEVDFTP